MTNEMILEDESSQELPESWVVVPVEELFDVNYGKGLTEASRDESGDVPVYGSNGITGWHSEALTYGPTTIIGRKGSAGEVHLSKVPCWIIDTAYFVEDSPYLDIGYIYYARIV
jgi:type I restriction enzyme S subunit